MSSSTTTGGSSSSSTTTTTPHLTKASRSFSAGALSDYASYHKVGHRTGGARPSDPPIVNRVCTIGVCAMNKKVKSKPMIQILDRLRATGDFAIKIFDQNMFLNERIPVSSWPVVDCFVSFYSSGFPLDRAIKYVRLRKPYCVNDLESQRILQNRRLTYELLTRHDIPTPRHIFVDREPLSEKEKAVKEGQRRNPNPVIVEHPDYITVNGERMDKPFVEKPFNGDDHNVYIYYPQNEGGGVRRLFRKVKNKSSEFYPNASRVRRTGSYIYEEFRFAGIDLKVYTIGPSYAHCESRKSPALDGRVMRNPDGKEKRLLTLLSDKEKKMAALISTVFQQNICGFDIVRWKGESYVIDVNGWSFVKGNLRYYDKCARSLRKVFLGSPQGQRAMALGVDRAVPAVRGKSLFTDGDNNHVLRSMVGFFRHADRTPKQKVKVKVSDLRIVALLDKPKEKKEKKEKDTGGKSKEGGEEEEKKQKKTKKDKEEETTAETGKEKAKEKTGVVKEEKEKETAKGAADTESSISSRKGCKESEKNEEKDGAAKKKKKELKWKKAKDHQNLLLPIINDIVKEAVIRRNQLHVKMELEKAAIAERDKDTDLVRAAAWQAAGGTLQELDLLLKEERSKGAYAASIIFTLFRIALPTGAGAQYSRSLCFRNLLPIPFQWLRSFSPTTTKATQCRRASRRMMTHPRRSHR
jgi:hypothetical protein